MIIDPYRWHPVRVTEIFPESPDAISIHTERPADYSFEPGQHAIIRATLPDGTKRLRQYSYANAPSATRLQFTITRSPNGEVSSWFIDTCSTASVIEISQPFTGPLKINLGTYRHVGMIAGGSGIAPMLSYLDMLRATESTIQRTLLYTTRASSRCADEFLQPVTHEEITVRISDEQGRLSQQEIIQSLQTCDIILLCGSRQFVTTLRDMCSETLPAVDIRAEAFSLT